MNKLLSGACQRGKRVSPLCGVSLTSLTRPHTHHIYLDFFFPQFRGTIFNEVGGAWERQRSKIEYQFGQKA